MLLQAFYSIRSERRLLIPGEAAHQNEMMPPTGTE
jgi:hypothetical protein